jgi:sortase A
MPDATASAAPAESRRDRRAARRRRPVSVVGVFGEVLITGGVLVFLFIAWQLWWNDLVVAGEQASAAGQISQQWIDDARAAGTSATPTPTPTSTPSETAAPLLPAGYGTPVVAAAPAEAQPFAVLYVPRYGAAYSRTIAEGVGLDVLNSPRLGIGHYPGTQMPGEVGNFVVAAHRSANGGGMHLINELQLGDPIFVQTAAGYYTYRFRDLEYVQPTDVGVLAAVPHAPAATPVDRIITLTSCNPLYSTAERIIAYGVFDSWQPISAGPPAELAAIIAAQAAG